MADDLTTPVSTPEALPGVDEMLAAPAAGAEPGSAKKGGGFKAFLGTTLGKIVIGGIGLAVLGAIIAVVAVVLISFFGASVVQKGVDQALQGAVTTGAGTTAGGVAGGSAAGTGTAAAKEGTHVPLPVANSQIFTFRDIFDPLAKEVVSASEDTSSTFSGEEDTLYLLDVVTEDGVRHAVLWWNEVVYTLAAGEVIEGTAWQVISVGADSATMLYGDSTVTLRVGQGSVAAK